MSAMTIAAHMLSHQMPSPQVAIPTEFGTDVVALAKKIKFEPKCVHLRGSLMILFQLQQ